MQDSVPESRQKNELEVAIEEPQMELWVAQLKKVLKGLSKADLVRRCAALTVEVFLLQKAVKVYEETVVSGFDAGKSGGAEQAAKQNNAD